MEVTKFAPEFFSTKTNQTAKQPANQPTNKPVN